MSFDWEQFQETSEWFEFKEIGDSAVGEVITVRLGTDFNGASCPELVIRPEGGEARTLTAGQKVLRARLADLKPMPGDKIAIVYSGVGDAKPGKAPAKLFTVQVRRADGSLIGDNVDQPTQPTPPPAAPAPTPAPQPAATSAAPGALV